MTLVIGTRLGRYEIQAPLGAGGMGEVFRAHDTRLDRDVAVKVLPDPIAQDNQALARFQREAKAVAALSHPNILAIYDIGTDQGITYVVMELLEGQTLHSRIRRSPLDWRSAVDIAHGVAEGLAAAHAKGIIHRDIKPANIFLTSNGSVKILDFGLARIEAKGPGAVPGLSVTITVETQPGVLMGTVAYMSPEQIRGQPADARSDVFALGCVLSEMLSGRPPFLRETNADMMAAILHDPPPAFADLGPDVPAELEAVLARCLEKDPPNRFPAGRELRSALKSLLTKEGVAAETAQWNQVETMKGPRAGRPRPRAEASIAVLPFVNMSSDKENEYFSDGLAEELINALTKVEGLRVAPRTSAFAFKGKNEDIRKIGEQLDVRTVLEGTVRKAGNRLRINAQLVNVPDSSHLWSETYNRQLEDVFAIQDEIAQNIVKALRVILSDKDRRAMEKAQAANVQAYDYYLRGRQFFLQFRRQAFEFARQMFGKAIAIDPNYARAHAGLADCCSLLYTRWDATEANLKGADDHSRRALQLDPESAEAHVARGLAVSLTGQFDQARTEFETAIRLNPELFEAYYFFARARQAEGKLQEAAALYEQASRLRPEDYQAPGYAGAIYAGLGRTAEAEASYRRNLQLIDKHLEIHPDDARALYLGAIACCRLTDRERGLDMARRSLAIDPEEPMTLYAVACVYAILGEIEPGIDCLSKAVANGYSHKEWIEHDADLDSLRSHPRFQALMKKL